MKSKFWVFAVVTVVMTVCSGCLLITDYYELSFVEQSGNMICISKSRTPALYKAHVNVTTSVIELFVAGQSFKPEEFPDTKFTGCRALNKKLMSLTSEDGSEFLWIEQPEGFKLKKLAGAPGELSNDLQWLVTPEKRFKPETGEEIFFKAELPSDFLGNSPDWKTIITRGEDFGEENLISLYVVDVETGIAEKRFVRRADYPFLLADPEHSQIGTPNLLISSHFGWLPGANGKYQLVYPVLRPNKITNKE